MTPWLDDGDVQLHHGDCLGVLADLPAGSVQTCVTSPPYWGLRDYGADGQLGLEATPAEYVERLVEIFDEVRRVLQDDGTLWLNLGDCFNAYNGGAGPNTGAISRIQSRERPGLPSGYGLRAKGLKPKDLVGIPWRVAFALQEAGWYLRSDIIWSKPNPMPESISDRPTKAHEYVFLLAKSQRYFYDADAIREPAIPGTRSGNRERLVATAGQRDRVNSHLGFNVPWQDDGSGRNARSVWEIATQPTPEAHFATYPEALVRRCILAGSSEAGECSACGTPWRREGRTVIDTDRPLARREIREPQVTQNGDGTNARGSSTWGHWTRRELGDWQPSCECNGRFEMRVYDPVLKCELPEPERVYVPSIPLADHPTRPQTVLDPFIGSGTTALVARKHGRRAVGIDLNESYLGIAARRLGQQSLFAEIGARETFEQEVSDG